MSEIKWLGSLSVTERNNIGLIQVRQNNIDSEVFGFVITDKDGKPYNLKNKNVLFSTYFDKYAPVEEYANVVDEENGKIVYTMSQHDMQKPVRINFAYFKIMDSEGNFIDSTQNFSYDILPSIESKCCNAEPYIIRLEEILDVFANARDEAQKEIQIIIENFNKTIIQQEEDYKKWFDSIKGILESIDPGGVLLSEIIKARDGEDDLDTRLKRDHRNVLSYIEKNTQKFIRLEGPKAINVTGTGSKNSQTLSLSDSSDLVVGDEIGIANAGTDKNKANIQFYVQGTATSSSDVSVFINADSYEFSIAVNDTKEQVLQKIKTAIPLTVIEEMTNRILFTTGDTISLKVTVQGFQGTGITIGHVEDNFFETNWLRTKITAINDNEITIADALLKEVEDEQIIIDHTTILNDVINQFDESDGYFFIGDGSYNILGRIDRFLDKNGINIINKSHLGVLDFSYMECQFLPYIFSDNIYYYPDGQGLMFSDCDSVYTKNVNVKSKEYAPMVFRGTTNVLHENINLYMDKAKNMNHAGFSVYAPYTQDKNASNKICFKNGKFDTAGMAFISVIDFDKTTIANTNISFENMDFVLREDTNFDEEKIVEHIKLDTNTNNVKFKNCTFDGGDLSSVTLEEGTRNVRIEDCDFIRTNNQFIRMAKGQTNRTTTRLYIKGCYFANFTFAIRAEVSDDFTMNGLFIQDCLVDNGINENVGTFAHLSNVNDLVIDGLTVLNSGKMKSSIVIVQNSRTVNLENIKVPGTNSVDAYQVRIIDSDLVVAKDLDLVTLSFERIQKGSVFKSNIRGRMQMTDNLDISLAYNKVNSDDYQIIANYYPLINIESTKDSTAKGKYNIDFNTLYSTFNARGIVTNKDTIIVNKGNNIERGIRAA